MAVVLCKGTVSINETRYAIRFSLFVSAQRQQHSKHLSCHQNGELVVYKLMRSYTADEQAY
jgi:hypothetical protein